jgi:hypothetical protein
VIAVERRSREAPHLVLFSVRTTGRLRLLRAARREVALISRKYRFPLLLPAHVDVLCRAESYVSREVLLKMIT